MSFIVQIEIILDAVDLESLIVGFPICHTKNKDLKQDNTFEDFFGVSRVPICTVCSYRCSICMLGSYRRFIFYLVEYMSMTKLYRSIKLEPEILERLKFVKRVLGHDNLSETVEYLLDARSYTKEWMRHYEAVFEGEKQQ